jgi:hypothetical protein
MAGSSRSQCHQQSADRMPSCAISGANRESCRFVDDEATRTFGVLLRLDREPTARLGNVIAAEACLLTVLVAIRVTASIDCIATNLRNAVWSVSIMSCSSALSRRLTVALRREPQVPFPSCGCVPAGRRAAAEHSAARSNHRRGQTQPRLFAPRLQNCLLARLRRPAYFAFFTACKNRPESIVSKRATTSP